MLSDGSNPEGVEPDPSCTLSRADLTDLVVYGFIMSPAVTKVRCFLTYHNVPYTHIKDRKKSTAYTHVPVIDVAGRQINDSFIILKVLSQSLNTQFDHEWEFLITYKFTISLFQNVTYYDAGCLFSLGFGPLSYFLCCLTITFMWKARKRALATIPKSEIVDCAEFLRNFRDRIGLHDFFSGNTPGHVDLSLYSTLLPFKLTKAPTVLKLLEGANLWDWWNRMEMVVTPGQLFSNF